MMERPDLPTIQPFTMPPPEFRLYDPLVSGAIDTPLDARGLVDLDELVGVVRSTVAPEYTWTSAFNDVHHLQWFANLYGPKDARTNDAFAFRELASRKAYVPRVFHNWTHAVTAPPPVPPRETMRHAIDAHHAALDLARTARLAVRLSRMVRIPAHRLAESLDREYENYCVFVENARLVPPEFSHVALQEVEARSPEDLFRINKYLGRMALDRVPVRSRALTA